jgi:uncharacterized membrane protein
MGEEKKATAERLAAYSDAVFAVIVTIMALELEAPDQPAFSALLPLWPTAISYAVSYLFIAIIWINHHYLMRFTGRPDAGLDVGQLRPSVPGLAAALRDILGRTHRPGIGPGRVLWGLFVCIDIAYNLFERQVLANASHLVERARRLARGRSLIVLTIFTTAGLVAFLAPRAGFGLICVGLVLHLRPEVRR